jgi:hypothetical protein
MERSSSFGFSGSIVEIFTRRLEDVAEKRAVVPALRGDGAEALLDGVDDLGSLSYS